MSTTIVVNSLVRYDDQVCEQPEPNPFDFTIPKSEVSKWRFKKLPHSHFALRGRNTRDKGGYEVKLDNLIIPTSIMPDPEPMVFYQFEGTPSNIDIGYATRIRCNNKLCQQIIDQSGCNCEKTMQYITCMKNGMAITCQALVENCYGGLGCTGVTTAPVFKRCEDPKFTNLQNTWVAYYDCTINSGDGAKMFHQYKSKTRVSVKYEAWFGSMIKVNIRDSCGAILKPHNVDVCNGDVCDYAKLFCKENQVIAILNHHYIPPPPEPKSTIDPGCFVEEH